MLALIGDYLSAVIYVLIAVAAAMTAMKIYVKSHSATCQSDKKLAGKTVIVTGASSGIGKETARDLAKRGARVILTCREFRKGNRAREELLRTTGNRNIIVRQLDLASLASIRDFAVEVIKYEERLDILVNNAGVFNLGNLRSEDGLLTEMQVNYFGPFLLTNLLRELLIKSSPARVIFVAAQGDAQTEFNLNNLNFDKSYNSRRVYNTSKLANIIHAQELARRLRNTGVTVNSLNPGVAATELYRNYPRLIVDVYNWFLGILAKTPVEGAQTTIFLAVADEVEKVTGKYFVDCKEGQVCALARDEGLAKKLWEKSEQLVELIIADSN